MSIRSMAPRAGSLVGALGALALLAACQSDTTAGGPQTAPPIEIGSASMPTWITIWEHDPQTCSATTGTCSMNIRIGEETPRADVITVTFPSIDGDGPPIGAPFVFVDGSSGATDLDDALASLLSDANDNPIGVCGWTKGTAAALSIHVLAVSRNAPTEPGVCN